MNNITKKMATIGITNATANAISKGGMILSNKQLTEAELNYISEHVVTK